jgi:hypothetical protein
MNDDYNDIINLPRPQSRNHKPMPMINRAAQFAPFSALNGHEEALKSRREENTSSYEEKGEEGDIPEE